jgi:AmmeMemoRadiSam system protein A
MSPLDSDERKTLLRIARIAIEKATQRGSPESAGVDAPLGQLGKAAGAFVTLRRGKNLRGCVGHLEASAPSLASAVAWAAQAAALEDPRFEPVRPEEVAALTIEISVLTPFKEIAAEKIIPGTHGIVIQRGERRGLLLPQVATEHKLSRDRFLEETCVKAGLPRDAWRDPTTRVFAFTAEVFSEEDYTEKKSGANEKSAPQ